MLSHHSCRSVANLEALACKIIEIQVGSIDILERNTRHVEIAVRNIGLLVPYDVAGNDTISLDCPEVQKYADNCKFLSKRRLKCLSLMLTKNV